MFDRTDMPGALALTNRDWVARQMPQLDAESQQRRWHELGMQAIAARSVPPGFPARLVEEALAAGADERRAQSAFDAAAQRVEMWIAQHGPSDAVAAQRREEQTIEARTALRAALAKTERAAIVLGHTLETWRAAQLVLDQADGRLMVAERAYREALAAIDSDVRQAEQRMAAIAAGAHQTPPLLSPPAERWPTM